MVEWIHPPRSTERGGGRLADRPRHAWVTARPVTGHMPGVTCMQCRISSSYGQAGNLAALLAWGSVGRPVGGAECWVTKTARTRAAAIADRPSGEQTAGKP